MGECSRVRQNAIKMPRPQGHHRGTARASDIREHLRTDDTDALDVTDTQLKRERHCGADTSQMPDSRVSGDKWVRR